jgi:ABC-type glycerol-3-phosphate transport system substrate-binding protein
MPSSPQFSNPELENILYTWQTLLDEGVISNTIGFGFGGDDAATIPMQLDGSLGYSQGFNNQENVRQAALLPSGTAGLNVQGFAVSSGTQYPEMAYELAKFLTTRSELTDNPFGVEAARYSVANDQTNNNGNGNNQGGGPGGGNGPGGGGGIRFGGGNVPEHIQPVIDEALTVAMPVSELRYASYLNNVLTEMESNGGDVTAALQAVEVTAVANQQTAIANSATVSVIVATPPPVVELSAGQIELNIGVNTGFGFGGPGGNQFANQEEWDALNDEFLATESVVGRVNLESVNNNDLDALSEQYDCFILSENVVAGNDVSSLLNLDPLLDTDLNFDRNDVVGNALVQLQQDNRTYGIPIVIQPQMLQYDTELFRLAGVPEPIDGWTIDEFADALRLLSSVVDPDTAPFVPNDPSGAYINMLVAAYGGLPIDYRTDPPTLNFTDAATVDAIRQTLDLVVNGYIEYTGLSTIGGNVTIAFGESNAITTDLLRGIQFTQGGPGGGGNDEFVFENTTSLVLYPQGSQYGVISYNIYAGYISTTAENPEACYRWLSSVAQNPQLFSGMPAQRSLINDPEVVASMDADTLAVYAQVDAIMQNPNTIVFPSIIGGGRGATSFLTEYWLKQAYDNYVLDGADLETELMEAEVTTQAYLDCVATLPPTDPSQGNGFGAFQGLQECAQRVDPEFNLGN